MKPNIALSFALALTCALTALFGTSGTALAHGHVEVGDYELVIGFHNEPAYQGEPNGLDLFVTNTKTQKKVVGLEKTLKAEIIFGASKKELELRPQFGTEGDYTTDVIPTAAGDYTWRIFGQIEDTPVDESMMSGPNTFGAVEPKSAVAFPAAEPTSSELKANADVAAQTAQTALMVGAFGALLGLVGTVLGFLGMRRGATTQTTGEVTTGD